jgi:CRP-like cAMP-binding protein
MTIRFPPPRKQIEGRLKAGDMALAGAVPARLRNLNPREILVRTGEPHREIYRLTSGWMARLRTLSDGRQQIIMVFLPGDLLALKAMLIDRQPDSIQCITRATVQALGCDAAIELARGDPDVSLRFMWQLAEDERRLHNWVIALGRGRAVERIATLMLDFRGRLTQAGLVNGDQFPLPMTQEQLGDHLGLTLVHVNRTLKKLRDEGVLTVAHGWARIHDVDTLACYAAPMQDIFERESESFGGGAAYASGPS